MNPAHDQRRRVTLPLVVSLALAAAMLGAALTAAHASTARAAEHTHASVGGLTAGQVAFHDHMRKLWEDHVTWTRLAIVTFADGSKGFPATAARLLRNQTDIGDAIKPFYGDAAGRKLSALLHAHITIAVDVLQAAKAGDSTALGTATKRWYRNANDIADFLAAANPRSWPDRVMRAEMKHHLDQTLTEASDELHGNYAASVKDYEAVHRHILAMADMLSTGIMRAFPASFR